MSKVNVSIDLPRSVLGALRLEPESFGKEMRLAAAAKWYEIGLISRSQAAEVAGISRAEFLTALERLAVSPFPYNADSSAVECQHWVVNASALIVFGKIGPLDLLRRLSKAIVVPQAAADKVAGS